MLNCKIQFSVALLLYTTLLCSLLFSTVATQIPLDSRIIVADNTNWVSSNEDFVIGFFQHSEQPNQYSVGIHFNSSSIPIDKQTVVWVAGAEIVVNNGSSFHLTANGELQQYIAQLLLLFINKKVGLGSSIPSTETGKGKSKVSKHVTHGYYCVKGKSHHPMEDYAFAQFREVDDNELGLFAIFDGHLSNHVPDYLKSNLFENILNQPNFWTDTENAVRKAYLDTDAYILEKSVGEGKGGSTAVTAILINCQKLVVANVGDSRAVICRNGKADQLSVDHEPQKERDDIEGRGGFVTQFPGDVPRVDGQLAVARAFGDKSIKVHLSSDPDVVTETIDDNTEFAILASDGIWHVMSNQEAVDCIKNVKDAKTASKNLIEFALSRNSTDDISVIVVKFQ